MRILIADAEGPRAKGLAEACLARNHSVERVAQGAAALEWTLERQPELVVCPLDLPVIDGGRLAEILRSNPRTRDVSFLFLVKDELDAPVPMDPRDAVVVAPWHKEAVLDYIDAVLERSARQGEVRKDAEMAGQLSQISAGDLLQLFQMNRKSGTLRIQREGAAGHDSVQIRGGQVVDASVVLPDGTSLSGEKAFYRILCWEAGRFEFMPGETPAGGRIRKPTRELLLEGMRLLDEREQRRRTLPPDEMQLRLARAPESVPSDLHPQLAQVLAVLEAYSRVGDIVDHCPLPDLQVLHILGLLRQHGALALDEPASGPRPSKPEEERLLTPTQVRRLREWSAAQRPAAGPVLKVLIVSATPSVLLGISEVLKQFSEFRPGPRLERAPDTGLGTLGHFPLGEGLSLRLLAVPADTRYAPLWEVAAAGMLGAVIVPNGPYGNGLEATEAAFTRLDALGSRPALHLFLADGPSASLSEEAREQSASLEEGTVFVLPASPSDERVPVLRNVFASLVP
ncbi:MAG: DUF4388 domain-containing protein [Deltaproteobacteria bacterium]|nr:DUF4388 domain-containing protein [Deltaproteobacteria bacterium]